MNQKEFRAWQAFIIASSPIAMISTILILWAAYRYLPIELVASGLEARLQGALLSLTYVALGLFLIIAHIGNMRFLSDKGINPLAPVIDEKIQVFWRILQNSLEQSFIFSILVLAIAVTYGIDFKLIPLATVWFILARIVFTVGYLRGWKYRAPGMGMTFGTNIALFIALAYSIFGM
jgi:hypothetical protein